MRARPSSLLLSLDEPVCTYGGHRDKQDDDLDNVYVNDR